MVDSSDGIRTVVLRRNQGSSLGFSIMGGAGFSFPPVIYGIEKDSPAARSGLLEAGDIILAINEREVVKLSTKEVLKCLRLSGDIVNIKYKRDAQIVSKVREFLSTPNYLEGGGDHHHHHSVGSQVVPPGGKARKSPSLSSSRSSSTTSQSNSNTPPGGEHGDEVDCHSKSKALNPNSISFSDDIFINHSTSTGSNSNHKSTSSANGNNKNNWKTPAKKNYEAFVMTGDAILNISRVDPNDTFRRQSPTKTKLTPMSVPPHQIYTDLSSKRSNPKVKTPSPPSDPAAMVEQVASNKDVSESSDVSPPLPPPPKSSSTSASNSSATEPTHVTVKSDNLPPPPASLMENYDEEAELLLHNAQSHSNGNGFARAEDLQHFVKAKGMKGQRSVDGKNTNGNNNNEDTSISSSVMSDSGEELEEDDEKPRNSRKKHSMGSENEKDMERYNEYVLLNGTSASGAAHEDDDDQSSASSTRAKGYEKTSTPVDSDQDDVEEMDGGLSRQQQQIRRFQSLHSSSGGGESFNSSGGDSDGSDVESMRVAPVTKAVDIPSAERLAKRLFALDGFKVSDVWRQLSKANDFSRTVATEYLSYFDFKDEQLDISLRKFLNACPLRGETTEKERVLTYFSTRYVDCNPDLYSSPDAVHTLACALMLLNSDLYSPSGGAQGRRMTAKDFIQNLSGLNDGQNFPEQILRKLYQSIKAHPLAFPSDNDDTESNREVLPMDPSVNTSSKEFKRGYLKKKSTFELGGKKTPLGKRSWKMFFCRLRDLVLVLSTDETNKASVTQNTQTIKLHHAHAEVAQDYQKKPYVFQLTLADRSQYLFQSSDIREMNSWIDNINLNAARFSSPALEAPCGSMKRFERPLLPSAISRLSQRDQLLTHQGAIAKWEEEQEELKQILSSKRKTRPSKREVKERQSFYASELNRYKMYVDVLERMSDKIGSGEAGGHEELIQLQVLPHPPSVLVEMDECS